MSMRMSCRGSILAVVAFIATATFIDATGEAAEFRRRITIPGPTALAPGARSVANPQPVDRKVIEAGVEQIFAAFADGGRGIDRLLASDFANRQRLIDDIGARVPRDARLRVLAIQSVRTMEQVEATGADGRPARVSRVIAIVRSQLEYDDPVAGFRRLEGVADYIFRIEQRM
ncbi:MAG: hypothetical protein FJX53_10730 [Alphaproteobacteria bacterium]|nr:hypothetical protein [Alphaproteobacteria bacterium]